MYSDASVETAWKQFSDISKFRKIIRDPDIASQALMTLHGNSLCRYQSKVSFTESSYRPLHFSHQIFVLHQKP